ncbi:hypothetical protein BVER_01878 [Candidatus Burkholderia verschuerenii]|uniref:Uncharacterized protein n=1 Tax=Candidatus Burkholderia verschuerenii TaxID=242163 RepID=A0A0L0MHT2_9BURK|nr:hypothetical protein [Candidatus Burkholderia verschuerenii]KND62237.1 hypothetical protein BVER_01878 [Candidatus Burkholderia verschuerenii]
MLNRMKMAMAATMLAAASALPIASAAESAGVVWAANPVGVQAMPDASSVTLLSSGGYAPLKTSGGKCLLVARRGTQIVAIELSPLLDGGKVIGWKPQAIDMNTLTSKWGYHADGASNPVTTQIAMQNNSALNKDGSYSTSSTWKNTHVQTIASGESESAVTVTVNGKTYRKYSHFKPATPDAPLPASDEYFCR